MRRDRNLVQGESAYAAYRTVRDIAIFTNKRLFVRDVQGLTGKKVEAYSLPWSRVDMWSSENAGHIKVNLKRGIDIRKLDNLIAWCVLWQ